LKGIRLIDSYHDIGFVEIDILIDLYLNGVSDASKKSEILPLNLNDYNKNKTLLINNG